MYSTKYWDITTKTGDRYAYVSPATRTLDTPDCYPNTGYSGFQIDVWRYFKKPGSDELERTDSRVRSGYRSGHESQADAVERLAADIRAFRDAESLARVDWLDRSAS